MNRLTNVRGRMARLALIGAAAVLLTGAGPAPDVYIQSLKGSVEVGTGEPPVWRAAKDGDRLGPYDSIRTGASGRAEVHLSTGTVRLYPSSLLHLASDPGDSSTERVKMEQGTSLFDVLKRSGDDTFEVETHDALLVVKGTRFSVSVTPERSTMAVFRGLVGVSGLNQAIENEILVRPGFAVVGAADAPFELVVNSSADPWNGWTQDRPMPGPVKPMSQPPAKIALDMAKTSALLSARPMVAKRMVEMKATRGMQAAGAAKAQRAKQEMQKQVANRAASKPDMEALKSNMTPDLDPVQNGDSAMMDDLQEEYVESVVEGGTGTAGFEIELVNGNGQPGPDGVRISAASIDEFHSKGQLQGMVTTGTVNFSPALVMMLTAQGMDPMQFAFMLDQMTNP